MSQGPGSIPLPTRHEGILSFSSVKGEELVPRVHPVPASTRLPPASHPGR